MSRRDTRRTGRLGSRLALATGVTALIATVLVPVLLVPMFRPHVGRAQERETVIAHLNEQTQRFAQFAQELGAEDEKTRQTAVRRITALARSVQPVPAATPEDPSPRAWTIGLLLALLAGCAVAIVAWLRGGAIASRLTDLGLAVSKLGRGATEVRVRVSGNDEVTALGRAIQYLATDLQAMHSELAKGAGSSASLDPQVRELRDRSLSEELGQAEGYEIDAAIGAGSRGGLDFYGAVAHGEGAATVWVVSAEGGSAMSVLAAFSARDEIVRALESGATARKALAHTNRVLHRRLPRGACAKASLLEVQGDEVKLYQAGYRAPLWICRAGEVLELNAEGLALGLDAGPVFEKGLRSEKVPMQPGVRLVQTNEAGVRMQDFLDLVRDHSPKHTAPFMNLVLGSLEGDAGEGGLREDVLLVTVKRG